MQQLEKDPQQCRQLRQNDEIIRAQIKKLADDEARARNDLELLQAEILKMIDELENLRKIQAGQTIISATNNISNSADASTNNDVADKIAVLEKRISDGEIKIGVAKSQIRQIQDNKIMFENSLAANSEKMRELNCVT